MKSVSVAMVPPPSQGLPRPYGTVWCAARRGGGAPRTICEITLSPWPPQITRVNSRGVTYELIDPTMTGAVGHGAPPRGNTWDRLVQVLGTSGATPKMAAAGLLAPIREDGYGEAGGAM